MTSEIQRWLDVGRNNLAEHYRTEFHDNLRNPSRDYWTNVFEAHADDALERVAGLLQEAKLRSDGCMVLGGKTPRKVKFKGGRKYAYQFVHTVLSAMEASYQDVVRHTCHNRNCIRPDHLIGGTRAQNYQDERERRYLGR
jgi:Zinc-binding loop region of homing endonuclease